MARPPFDPDGPPANGGRAPAGVPESDIADSVVKVSAAARQHRQQAEDDTFITAGVGAAFRDFDALFEERKTSATQGPEGFAETFSRDLRDAVPALMDRLRADGHRPSEAGIDGLAQRLEMIRGQFGTRAITHENNARVLGMAGNLDRTLEGLRERAHADPERFDALMVSAGDALRRAGSHLDPAAVESRRPALEAIAEAAVLGRIVQDPLGAIDDLKIGFYDQDLPRPTQEKLLRRAEAALRDQEAAAELAQANQQASARAEASRRLIALEGAIKRGEAGEHDIAAASDILNDNTRARLSALLQTRKAEDAARTDRIAAVTALLDGEETNRLEERGDGAAALRPGSPGWQPAVNEHYAAMIPTLDRLDPAERAHFDEGYAKKTGVLPDAVANRLRAGLLSADPNEQVQAAERVVRFRNIDPALLAAIPRDERARAEAIHGFTALGLPSERAAELTDRKLEEERKQTAKTAVGEIRNAGSEVGQPNSIEVAGLGNAGLEGDFGATGESVFELVEATAVSQAGETNSLADIRIRDPETGAERVVSEEQLDRLADLAEDLGATEDEPPDELIAELGEVAVSLLPIVGEAISAKEAYDATRAALAALEDDDLAEAALKGGAAAIAAFGAIPIFGGTVRLTKGVARALPVLFKLLKQRMKRRAGDITALITRGGRTASRVWYRKWSDTVLSRQKTPGGFARARGQSAGVGRIDKTVIEELKKRGIDLPDARMTIGDRDIINMVRTGKKDRLPDDVIRDLPDILENPKAVLLDTKDNSIIYVFDVPGKKKLGKVVVKPQKSQKRRTVTGTKNIPSNIVTSGRLVKRVDLTTKQFEALQGRL